MTKTIIQLPAGFTPVATAPTGSYYNRYEVVFAPSGSQTHFENGVACYDAERREGSRWRTTDGDAMSDYGVDVVGWRRQTDEMLIVRVAAPAPAPETGTPGNPDYDKAIALLAQENFDAEMDGRQDARPSGVGLTAKLFGVTADKVQEDYRRVSKEIGAAHFARR